MVQQRGTNHGTAITLFYFAETLPRVETFTSRHEIISRRLRLRGHIMHTAQNQMLALHHRYSISDVMNVLANERKQE